MCDLSKSAAVKHILKMYLYFSCYHRLLSTYIKILTTVPRSYKDVD